MNEAWELPVLQFLNDLLYLKMKRDKDAFEEQKILNKQKLYGKKR